MRGFTREEKDLIVRDYLRLGGSQEGSFCKFCGEELDFRFEYRSGGKRQILVACSNCKEGFVWQARNEFLFWNELHLHYFLECRREERPIRCPVCDSAVAYCEFDDGGIEFRCLFCARTGKVESGNRMQASSSLDTLVTLKV